MKYTLDISKLETQEVEVRQFEHNVTTVNADFTPNDINEDLQDLTPCILLSIGDRVTGENGLSYIITAEKTAISWEISETHTQRAGTFFAQFGFIADDGSLKAYTEKFVFRVLPSVDWQRAAFEYKPSFIEAFWNKIAEKIKASVPTKLSQLENDKSFVSTPDGLTEYAKTTDINEALKGYAKNSEVEEKISACAQVSQVAQELKSYAKTTEVDGKLAEYAKTSEVDGKLAEYAETSEVDEKLTEYAKTVTVNAKLTDYAKTTTVTSKISSNNVLALPKELFTSLIPSSASTASSGSASFTADSTGTYIESIFINKLSNHSSFSLHSLSILFNSTTKTSPVTAGIELYVNGKTSTAAGTKIAAFDNFFVKDETTYAVIALKKVANEYALFYSRYNSTSKITPATSSCYILGTAMSDINSIKIKFIPSADTPATTNFPNICKAIIGGQNILK